MAMKRKFLLLPLIAILPACESDGSLVDKALAIHDEVQTKSMEAQVTTTINITKGLCERAKVSNRTAEMYARANADPRMPEGMEATPPKCP